MKVLKFGGTSVGSARRIKAVADLVTGRGRNIVVLSAMAGTTNSLVDIVNALRERNTDRADSLLKALARKYADVIDELLTDRGYNATATEAVNVSFDTIRRNFGSKLISAADEREIIAQGELISTALMACYLREKGVDVALLPALEFMLVDHHNQPLPGYIADSLANLIEANADAALYLTQGFICRNSRGEIDNLQRGGSDYTATIIGSVIGAEEVEIWTDIDGMHNSDPRFVHNTRRVDCLNFDEAAELAYFGAKILHPTCIQPARSGNIPVRLLNTLDPQARGTIIRNLPPDGLLKAVAAKDGITVVNVTSNRMVVAPTFFRKVFEALDMYHKRIDLSTATEVSLSFTIDDTSDLDSLIESLEKCGKVTVDSGKTIICLVGDFHTRDSGCEAEAYKVLDGIPVYMTSYGASRSSISFLVDAGNKIPALQKLNDNLFN